MAEGGKTAEKKPAKKAPAKKKTEGLSKEELADVTGGASRVGTTRPQVQRAPTATTRTPVQTPGGAGSYHVKTGPIFPTGSYGYSPPGRGPSHPAAARSLPGRRPGTASTEVSPRSHGPA